MSRNKLLDLPEIKECELPTGWHVVQTLPGLPSNGSCWEGAADGSGIYWWIWASEGSEKKDRAALLVYPSDWAPSSEADALPLLFTGTLGEAYDHAKKSGATESRGPCVLTMLRIYMRDTRTGDA